MEKIKYEECWDMYPLQVEDLPAFMLVDLAFGEFAPISEAATCYWLSFEIPEPGDHGMGVGASVERLFDVEEHVVKTLQATALYYVGRLRSAGQWQMVLFGPEGFEPVIDAAVAKAVEAFGHIPYELGSKHDPQWLTYTEFIYPDPERLRWMSDRSVVENCAKHGDIHDRPRRVDHWMYFADKNGRDQASDACQADGFSVQGMADDSDPPRRHSLQVFRDDPIELQHIHAVTMSLVDIADRYQGEYDGWETFIVRSEETPGTESSN